MKYGTVWNIPQMQQRKLWGTLHTDSCKTCFSLPHQSVPKSSALSLKIGLLCVSLLHWNVDHWTTGVVQGKKKDKTQKKSLKLDSQPFNIFWLQKNTEVFMSWPSCNKPKGERLPNRDEGNSMHKWAEPLIGTLICLFNYLLLYVADKVTNNSRRVFYL